MVGIFEDDVPFPQVGYVNFLEGIVPVFISAIATCSEWNTCQNGYAAIQHFRHGK